MKSDTVYSYDVLELYSDEELIKKLKEFWGYHPSQRLSIIGKLDISHNQKSGRTFYFLSNLRSVNDFSSLKYPVDSPSSGQISQNVFVSPQYAQRIGNKLEDSDLCIADVELSPNIEREKRTNPFALQACSEIQVLKELPIDTLGTLELDDKAYVEKEIVDFYKKKHQTEIDSFKRESLEKIEKEYQETVFNYAESSEELKKNVDELAKAKSVSEKQIEELTSAQVEIEDRLLSADKLILQKDNEIALLAKNYLDRKKKMETNLERLNAFVEEKAEKLLKLELIEKSDLDNLLGTAQDNKTEVETVSFIDELEGDVERAVRYIQAFLYKKDIFYKQDLLRDFFALLRTNDLIILAGDSGSGKTNLARSMAEAINGKSIIIPVKPNWTSSEDLLGYYNPLEKKYLSTPFLDALIEASHHPEVPYLICLDEMNLARVEYYFADFLSLLEDRVKLPDVYLYSDTEASHTLAEFRTFIRLTEDIAVEQGKGEIDNYIGMLKDEKLNASIHKACGFSDGGSLLKYHSQLRRILSGFINTPSSIKMPGNVRIIGTINVDETTHYLSPKILDRAHVIRFTSPLLIDWQKIEEEVHEFPELDKPLKIDMDELGRRQPYPRFDREDKFAILLVDIAKEYLLPLGIDFGLRTVRQAMSYFAELKKFNVDEKIMLNNFILHKVLPKLMFDGNKPIGEVDKSNLLVSFRNFIENELGSLSESEEIEYCVHELDLVIENAKANDWVVNYWTR